MTGYPDLAYSNSKYLGLTLHHQTNKNLPFRNGGGFSCDNTSIKILKNHTSYNLEAILAQDTQNNRKFGVKVGHFYLDKFFLKDYNYLNTQYSINSELSESLQNQTTSFKINRFLYHYNLLHSRILKNSHKITMAKKTISSGFYDLKLADSNLWVSDFLNTSQDPKPFIRSELRKLYKNFFKGDFNLDSLNKTHTLNQTAYPMKFIKFYESSYFFNLKRFYLFNNLATQEMLLNKKPHLPQTGTFNTNSTKMSLKLNGILKNNGVINANLLQYPLTSNIGNLNAQNTTNLFTKNIVTSMGDSDLFIYDDELIIVNLTNTISDNFNKF